MSRLVSVLGLPVYYSMRYSQLTSLGGPESTHGHKWTQDPRSCEDDITHGGQQVTSSLEPNGGLKNPPCTCSDDDDVHI